jgi:hypothetical protein
MTDDKKQMPDVIYVRGYEKRKNNCGTWSIYNEPHSKWGPTGNVKGTHIRQKYIRADTIPAPEKIEGVQEAYDDFTGMVKYGLRDIDNERFVLLTGEDINKSTVETIRRALIACGAKNLEGDGE